MPRPTGHRIQRSIRSAPSWRVAAARQQGITRLVGGYRPSGRNQLVEEHYRKLGFELLERHPDGSTEWTLRLHDAMPAANLPMEICHLGVAMSPPESQNAPQNVGSRP